MLLLIFFTSCVIFTIIIFSLKDQALHENFLAFFVLWAFSAMIIFPLWQEYQRHEPSLYTLESQKITVDVINDDDIYYYKDASNAEIFYIKANINNKLKWLEGNVESLSYNSDDHLVTVLEKNKTYSYKKKYIFPLSTILHSTDYELINCVLPENTEFAYRNVRK